MRVAREHESKGGREGQKGAKRQDTRENVARRCEGDPGNRTPLGHLSPREDSSINSR